MGRMSGLPFGSDRHIGTLLSQLREQMTKEQDDIFSKDDEKLEHYRKEYLIDTMTPLLTEIMAVICGREQNKGSIGFDLEYSHVPITVRLIDNKYEQLEYIPFPSELPFKKDIVPDDLLLMMQKLSANISSLYRQNNNVFHMVSSFCNQQEKKNEK